jgi:hypothetical protein
MGRTNCFVNQLVVRTEEISKKDVLGCAIAGMQTLGQQSQGFANKRVVLRREQRADGQDNAVGR